MKRRGPLPWLALVLFQVSACAHVPPTPEAKEVDELKLQGTKALDDSEVKAKIVTSESSWWPSWVPGLGRVGWFDSTAWQADLRRITRYYEAHGFYQARVLEEAVTPKTDGHVSILVKVSEGEPSRIASVSIEGLEAVEPKVRDPIVASIDLKKGDIFLEDSWAQAKTELTSRLYESGYAEVVVHGEAVVDADAATVAVRLICTPGIRYRFGDSDDPEGKTLNHINAPRVFGDQVSAAAVRFEVAGDIRAGDYFSESAMRAAQARLFQMGIFSAVKVTRGAPQPKSGTIPVVIDVREGAFHTLRAGVGLGGDLVRQEIRLTGEYTNRNIGLAKLFSREVRLDRLTVKGKLGWAFLPTVWDVIQRNPNAQTGPTFRLLTEYEVPHFLGLRTVSFQSSLEALRTLDAAFDYWGGELKLGVRWTPRTDLAIIPTLNFNAYGLTSDIPSFSSAPTAALGCPRLPELCVVTYAELAIEFDRRDSKLEPTTGYFLGFSTQLGLNNNTTITPFARFVPEARGYVSFGFDDKFTLAGKVKMGTLLAPGNNTPIVARFFSGGSAMRGFSQRRLSPLAAVAPDYDNITQLTNKGYSTEQAQAILNECLPLRSPRPTQCRDFENGITLPVGGSGLFEASLELRWNLWKDLVLAVFSDAGMVSEEPLFQAPDLASLFYVAVGLGARYKTPLGPIRLDLAFRLPVGGPEKLIQEDARQVRVAPSDGCFLGIGSTGSGGFAGAPENRCSVHLSIGEAF